MAQMTIGLDLGSDSLKRVRLRSSFRTVELVDYVAVPINQDDRPYAQRLGEAYAKIAETGAEGDFLATCLPGDDVSIHNILLPFTDRRKITSTIGFELETLIPFALEDVVYDSLAFGQTREGTSRILVAVCPKQRLGYWLELFRGMGLDPRMLGADALAYASLQAFLPPVGENETQAIVDMGSRLTSVCILGGEGVEFARTMTVGGQAVTDKLSEVFKISIQQAEDGKRRGAFLETSDRLALTPERKIISEAIKRSLSAWMRDLRQTLVAHQTTNRKPVTRLWLCGSGAAIENLPNYLQDEFQIKTDVLSPNVLELPGVELLKEYGPHAPWTKALGLALHVHQGGRHGWLNFRRGAFTFTADTEYLRSKTWQVIVSLACLAVLAIGSAVVRYVSLLSADRALDQQMREVTKAILGKPYDNPDIAISVIKEKTAPEADPLPQVDALDYLREMHSRIPPETKVRIRQIDILPKKIQIEGYTDSFESVEKIKAALRTYNKCFSEIQAGKTRKTNDDKEVEFELDIAVKC